MKNVNNFIKSLSTLFYSWGSDTPDEVYWGCNELLDWFEQEFDVEIGMRFERDSDYNSNYSEVVKKIKDIFLAKEKCKEFTSEILDKLGRSHTATIGFTKSERYDEPHALYTYRNEVFILMGGMDVPFEELDYSDMEKIIGYIREGSYKVDNSIQ
jgi:hypothetical protein